MDTISASAIGAALDMPASIAKAAALLLEDNAVSSDDIEKAHKLAKGSGKVYIHRLRKFLDTKCGIKLRSEPSGDYYLREADHKKLITRVGKWVSDQYHG